ncbi:conjugal transfer fertility inhibition protein FinO [Escherichia coli]|nr:conjugal transfer fertility inhibition protein FinO [Escherichia coli]
MTEQKRPVLTLKRKTEGETPTRSRKTIINVTTPPKWKVKKQKLAEEGCPGSRADSKKSAGQTGAVHLSEPALAG